MTIVRFPPDRCDSVLRCSYNFFIARVTDNRAMIVDCRRRALTSVVATQK